MKRCRLKAAEIDLGDRYQSDHHRSVHRAGNLTRDGSDDRERVRVRRHLGGVLGYRTRSRDPATFAAAKLDSHGGPDQKCQLSDKNA